MKYVYLTEFLTWCGTIFDYNFAVIFLFLSLVVCKIALIIAANQQRQKAGNPLPLLLFIIPLATYTFGEIAWVALLALGKTFFTRLMCRLAWHMQLLQFYTLCLFISSLTNQKYVLQRFEKLLLKVFFYFSFTPLFSLIIPSIQRWLLNANSTNLAKAIGIFDEIFASVSPSKEILLGSIGFLMLILAMIFSYRKIYSAQSIPYILRLQIRSFLVLLSIFAIPESFLWICRIIPQLNFFMNNFSFTIISSVLFTASLMFYARRIYQLRFLNLMPVISSNNAKGTNQELYHAKHALCTAQSISEIQHINAEFFQKTQGIKPDRIVFVLRSPELQKQLSNGHAEIAYEVEAFIHKYKEIVTEFFTEDSVLVYDELAFTYFYEESKNISILLSFLKKIGAAIFIPLKQSERIIGFIMIKKNQARDELFSQAVQMQMGLYGTYVTYTIMRLEQYQYKNLLEEREQLLLELRKVHQKLDRYQESFSSIVGVKDLKRHGILLYKSHSFSFVNTAAEDLVQINPNIHHGHPLCKALKEVVRRVLLYSNPHAMVEKNMSGLELYCHGFPYKKDEVFILISPADIMHTLKVEHMLVRPGDLDYLFFLYATDAGILVNMALPGKGETLQKFKLQFLKKILSKKSMVFDVHPDDLSMLLHLMQRILKQQVLHTIDIQDISDADVVCKRLFGFQTFSFDAVHIKPGLLGRLDESGILCIQNAHLLDDKTQHLLAQYMKTGSFTVYQTEKQVVSNAMIVLSSQENLEERTKNGFFAKELFEQVQDAIVSFPSLTLLPFAELETLAEGLQKQMIAVTEYHHLFGFSKHELEQLNTKRPCSIHELQQRIRLQLKQKMKKSPVAQEATSRPTEVIDRSAEKSFADPILVEAARLGKHALRDRKLMRELWDKLHSQSKIAQLLDVDRSSVHRRCREFGLGVHDITSSDVN